MRMRSMVIAGAMAAMTIPLSATSANAEGHEGTWAIKNKNSLKCLAIPGSSDTDDDPAPQGTAAIQFTCDESDSGFWDPDQQWRWALIPGATSTYTLMNWSTVQCLAIGKGSETKGAKAIQWPCNDGADEQEWIYDSSGRLRNNETGLCLAIPEGNTANAVAAIQWTCRDVDTNPEQKWLQVR